MTAVNDIPRDAKHSKTCLCADWDEVRASFDLLPAPKIQSDVEGEPSQSAWIFRGHKSDRYDLEPSVERVARGKCDWAVLELRALEEFQSKSPLHMDVADLPPREGDKLSWLALMQHYSVPTRLLDFTYSPYVALYFALRARNECERSGPVEVWAIDTQALISTARQLSWRADLAEVKRGRRTGRLPIRGAVSLHADDSMSQRDVWHLESEHWSRVVSNALEATGTRRAFFNESGFVAFALPPVQNVRLSNQQGAFLFNGAEKLTFQDSLFTMMKWHAGEWWRVYQVPNQALATVERKLFQMNIHDLSLFPDMEGLAGFIRQKSQLHWFPNDSS
jgi:hypothetical protein